VVLGGGEREEYSEKEREDNEPEVMRHELVCCGSLVRRDGQAAENKVDGEFRDLIGVG